MSDSSKTLATEAQQSKYRYFLTWRWHFYAGLFVIPFMLMLSLTGLVMLFDQEIEEIRYGDIIQIQALEKQQPLAVSKQLKAVQQTFPNNTVTQFIPAKTAEVANRFSIKDANGTTLFVTINQYTGEVLGTIDRSDSWYQLANDIHGTLLVGDWGDHLIEVAASLTIVLLVTGIYLWLPFDNAAKAGFLKVRTGSGTRILMRDLHANLGGTLSLVLLFFVLSGLAWAGIWGGKVVQPWSSFPAQKWSDVPLSSLTHQSLNHGSEEELPWNLEQTPLPTSIHDHSKMVESESTATVTTLNVDQIENKIRQLGFGHYKLHFPRGETGVFTASANTMSGDIINPTQDRTTHFDQYSGEVLADVTWKDYGVIAKMMAAGIALHQVDISIINKLINAMLCFAFVTISITGVVMWWIRRPHQSKTLGAPARFAHDGIWKAGLITLILICVAFPMAGVSILSVLALDWLVFSRSDKLQLILKS